MRTPSLRRRVVVWSVAVLALLLLVVGVGVDLALGSVLRSEQQQRLQSVAALGQELTGLSDQELASRLTMPGIIASIQTASGDQVVGVPQRPGKGGPPKPLPDPAAATGLRWGTDGLQRTLTFEVRSGATVQLVTTDEPIQYALDRFRVIMAIASVVAIALAAAVLPLVLRRAMRPLDALTAAARDTAAGDRGRRLAPQDPDTDLGRAAAEFDAMLEELEGAERRAEEATERLAQFLSDASHELRTPLAGISASAERLIRDPLQGDDRDRVQVQVVREARRASRLVDDLLLVSRLGELRIEPERRALRPLLDEAAHRFRNRRPGVAVEVRGEDATVPVDRLRFEQIVANLLTNAANAGAQRIRITSRVAGTVAAVRVSDDGPGIPEQRREAVFERLVRLDPSRSVGGAGLGLPIARGLAEAHGGTLTAVAPEDGDLSGAVLRLTLPADSLADQQKSSDTPVLHVR